MKGLFPARGGRGIALAPEGGVGVAKGLFPGRGGLVVASTEGKTSATTGGVGAIGTAGGRGSAVEGAVDPAEIPN